jgi:hypothetical protein
LKTIWPEMYFETSTNGRGVHGYFVLQKRGNSANVVNFALKRLQTWLRAEAARINADIEQVEIKGTCMELEFRDNKIQAVKYGMFAKLPRDVARFSEWAETTVIRSNELLSTRFDVVEQPSNADSSCSAKLISTRNPSGSQSVLGSVSGKIITEEELSAIPAYERLYQEWVPAGLKARKFAVNAHDFAVAMVIVRHFKASPNADGSLPCRRAEKLWTALFDAGDVERPWNHHRWKAIRDFLSKNGHINWQDHRYEYGLVAHVGSKPTKRGTACKWGITDEFEQILEQVAVLPKGEEEASFVDTEVRKLIPIQGNGKNLRPTPYLLSVETEQKHRQRAWEVFETMFAA